MHGYQLTFYTQQDRKHAGLPMSEWLVQEARRMGIGGATVIAAQEGFGHSHRLHSARFFELADQPVEITMALSGVDVDRLFARLREVDLDLFYVKSAIEFGSTGAM